MKIVIDVDAEMYDAACVLLSAEMRDWERRYDKIGYGWVYSFGEDLQARCFVRRIKDGLSLRQTSPRATHPDHATTSDGTVG